MFLFSEGWSTSFDGPGRRYIFYLKGCNLRCPWCASPESIHRDREILYYPDRVSSPPVSACPRGAVSQEGLDRNRCRTCTTYDCVTRWRNRAFELAGYSRTPAEILDRIRSLGCLAEGITFGGGEPTSQIDELLSVLTELRRTGMHTAVESNATTSRFCELPGRVDLLFCDLKRPEDTCLEHLLTAARRQENLIIRIPLVPGQNDSPESLAFFRDAIAQLVRNRPCPERRTERVPLRVEVLPLHHLGEVKYRALGLQYPMAGVAVPDKTTIDQFRQKLEMAGVCLI